MNLRKKLAFAMSLVALASVAGAMPSQADATCAGEASGGEWPLDGQDLSGQRKQAAEDLISTTTAPTLVPKWSLNTTTVAGPGGTLQTMPIVAEGCVYLQTSTGSNHRVIALNADTGALVWFYKIGASGGMAAPHVHDGVVYVNVPTNHANTGKGPHVLALDSQTGAVIFDGEGVCTQPGCANNAGATSPALYFDGMVWIGITNTEQDGSRVGGFAIVDAVDGSLLKRTYTVPDDQAALGFGGCAIWSAAAVDPVTKHGYVGTAQPSSWSGKESERCNAIIKWDFDRSSPTFGEIIGAAKGTSDNPPYIDVDFGGSGATIFTDADGRQLVAQQQKSGWLHAAYTRHMTAAWSTPTPGWGTAVGAYTKTASDGRNVFTVGNLGGPMVGVNGHDGAIKWATPVVSPVTQGAMAYANGVVFFNDEVGNLGAYDAANGVPLFARPMRLDGAGCNHSVAGGVSIARHTVYAACGSLVAAYGLPA
jgi:hypothetical protein